MKKITKNTIGLLASFLLLLGCNDDRLDVTSTDVISLEEVNKNESALIGAKNAIYNRLSRYDGLGRDAIVAGDIISDNAFVSKTNSGRFTYLNNFTYGQLISDFTGIDRFYDAIVHANAVINTTLPESNVVKQAKAEAYAGRALSYFYLVSLYSPSIKSGINQQYGVTIFTEGYEIFKNTPRSSVKEVYAQIESDLLQSLNLFNENLGTENKSVFSPVSVKLLLSRVYLYQEKWQESFNYAMDVDANHPGCNYVGSSDYASYFEVGGAETVFELSYSGGNGLGVNSLSSVYYPYGVSGYKQNLFRQSLVDLYDVSDVRKALYVTDPRSNNGGDFPKGMFLLKYINSTQEVNILRLTEAKLNKIEAMFHLGNEAGALTELNSFVATRGVYSYSGLSGQSLLDAILKERRLEFAGEGSRFFDLKRNNLPIIKDSNCDINCSVSPTDPKLGHLFVLPIPQYEIDNNSNIKQYPGY